MKLFWQDLPSEGKIVVGSKVRLKDGYTACYPRIGNILPKTLGTVIGFLTSEFVYVQYDNTKTPSEVYTHHLRKDNDNGWVTNIKRLELL